MYRNRFLPVLDISDFFNLPFDINHPPNQHQHQTKNKMAAVVEPKQVEAQVVAVATAAGPPMDYVAFANLANLDHCK